MVFRTKLLHTFGHGVVEKKWCTLLDTFVSGFLGALANL